MRLPILDASRTAAAKSLKAILRDEVRECASIEVEPEVVDQKLRENLHVPVQQVLEPNDSLSSFRLTQVTFTV